MKRIILVLVICLPLFSMAQSTELTSFNDIMTTLKAGNDIKAVFYYNECELISDNEIDEDGVDSITYEEIMTENFFTTIFDGKEGAAHFFID